MHDSRILGKQLNAHEDPESDNPEPTFNLDWSGLVNNLPNYFIILVEITYSLWQNFSD